MSAVVKCDNPACDRTRPPIRALYDEPWIVVTTQAVMSTIELDFCSKACVAAWARPAARMTVRNCDPDCEQCAKARARTVTDSMDFRAALDECTSVDSCQADVHMGTCPAGAKS